MVGARAFARAHVRVLVVALALCLVGVPLLHLPASAATNSLTQGNLLTAAQAGFDDATRGGWTAVTAASVAPVATPTHTGAGALAVTSTSAGAVAAASGSAATGSTPAVAGNRYAAQLWVSASSASRNVATAIYFADSAGSVVGSVLGQTVADSMSSWVRTPLAVGIAPASTAYVTVVASIGGTALGETHVIDDVTLTTAAGSSAALIGPLTTSGNRILDARGRPVIFRGFTRVGMEGSGDTPGQDELAHAKAWGTNIMRIPLSDAFWLSTTCEYKPTYPSQVDAVVSSITSMGMVALLDLHTNTITSPACGSVGQQPMADYPDAVSFWQQVAARYKGNPLVAFELYNEPHDVSDAIWRDGGSVTWKGTTYQAAGMQQMYDAVRSTGATNLVVVSGNKWSDLWPTTAPIAASNVIYSVHAYTCSSVPPPACTAPNPYDPPQFLDTWVTPSQTYPVMIGEFGFTDPMNATYNSNVIAYAEAHGWGWTNFSWGDTTWGPLALLATAGPGTTYEPKPSGMPALAAFPGLDTYAPAAPAITSPSTDVLVTSSSVPLAGTAEPYSTVSVSDAATTVGQANADGAGSWSTSISLTDGVHSLRATATDDAANVSPRSATRQITVATTDDVSASLAPPANSYVGTPAQHVVTVTNSGATPATHVAVTAGLSSTTHNISATPSQGTCTVLTTVNCAIGTVPAGASVTVTIGSIPTATGLLTVNASVTADQSDPNMPNNSAATSIAVAAGNGRLAFTTQRDGNNEIYTSNLDGTLTRLTKNAASDTDPEWSPDGTRIVFTSSRGANTDIYLMNADGTGVTRLTFSLGVDNHPAWSPDGKRIVFTSTRNGNAELYSMNVNGTGVVRLTNNKVSDDRAAWSSTGKIVFTSARDSNPEIYIMNSDGTHVVRLTSNTANDDNASWSPGGSKIVWQSNRTGGTQIWVMNADGSGAQALTSSNGANTDGAFAPTGAQVAFASSRLGTAGIYTMNADGTGQTRLTTTLASDNQPSWQRLTRLP